MKHRMVLSLAVLIFSGCSELHGPVSSQAAQAKALSNHAIIVKSYGIPNGIFRGVLWPSKKEKKFQIWVIKNNKEVFYNIPAPPEFIDNNKDSTEEWTIRESGISNYKIIYLADTKDRSKSLRIELPLKKRKYSFSSIKNTTGDEILIFMDISENVVDKGLFGYVILKNQI